MPRPKHEHPTPGELEVLKILWDRGPSTVREVMEILNHQRRRAYTSVMSLLGVMTDKGLLARQPQGRAFLYRAAVGREKTLGEMVNDLVGRAFEGSANAMIVRLLDRSAPSPEEIEKIRETIDEYRQRSGEE